VTRLFLLLILLGPSAQAQANTCHSLFRERPVPYGTIPISGYASVFNVLDFSGDVILPGAFKESLETRPFSQIPMLSAHDASETIGQWTAVREDGYGLYVEGYINPRTSGGNRFLQMMSRSSTAGLSVGFRTLTATRPQPEVREIKTLSLWEISLVNRAVNPLSSFRLDDPASPALIPFRPKDPPDWLHLFF